MKAQNYFFNTYKFSNHDNNNFNLLLRKGEYEYIDDWEKFNETSLPEKEDFYSHLTLIWLGILKVAFSGGGINFIPLPFLLPISRRTNLISI